MTVPAPPLRNESRGRRFLAFGDRRNDNPIPAENPVRTRPLSLTAPQLLGLLGMLTLAASGAGAQRPAQKVRLSSVIAAFLVDSGVRTRGLPWTTGSELPIRWATSAPVANSDPTARKQGVTHGRDGVFTGTVGDSVALGMTIRLNGGVSGLSGVTVELASLAVTNRDGSGFFVTREMIEQALRNEGITFQPLKCQRATEGASYGNLVDAVKAPGKTASGLWWFWQSAQQELSVSLTLLYRRTDMNQVECYTG